MHLHLPSQGQSGMGFRYSAPPIMTIQKKGGGRLNTPAEYSVRDSYLEALTQNELHQIIKSRVGTDLKPHNGEYKGTNQPSENAAKMKTIFK